MITEAQVQNLANSRKARQDKKVPLLINRDNFRLMPNTPLIRRRPQYMPYDGQADDDLETRRSYVTGQGTRRPRVVNTVEPEVFDIGKASKDELVNFAMSEYGKMLDGTRDIRSLRKEFAEHIDAVEKATNPG